MLAECLVCQSRFAPAVAHMEREPEDYDKFRLGLGHTHTVTLTLTHTTTRTRPLPQRAREPPALGAPGGAQIRRQALA